MTDESIPRPAPEAVRARLALSCPQALAETDFPCPECGRVFTAASGLGAHRWRKHGVRGYRQDGEEATARERRRWGAKEMLRKRPPDFPADRELVGG